MSRHIGGLEKALDTKLFHRHARGLVLTHHGERLFAETAAFANRIESATREIDASHSGARGPLSVTTTISFGSMWLAPRLARFYARFPDMRISLALSDEDLDLSMREAEAAIRFHQPSQADLVQRPLLSVGHHLYASPDYLAARGEPTSLEALDDHDLISYGPSAPTPIKNINWVLAAGREGPPRRPKLVINNIVAILEAVRGGLGIAALPDYVAGGVPDLKHILPDAEGPHFQAYFVYPSELRRSRRVAALRDFILDEVAAQGGKI